MPKPTRDLFEQVQQIVEDRTNKVGQLVKNLNGVVESPVSATEQPGAQAWFAMSVPTDSTDPSLAEFVNRFSLERPGHQPLDARGGEIRVAPTQEDRGNPILLLTTVRLQGSRDFPVEVTAPGYNISLYVDRSRVLSKAESLSSQPRVSSGTHSIAVLLSGGTGTAEVQLDPSISTYRMDPVPDAPSWVSKPIGNFLDDQLRTLANQLSWTNDALAGAWNVYRSLTRELPAPINVTDNGDNTLTLRLEGSSLDITEGDQAYTVDFAAGEVTDVSVVDVAGELHTDVTVYRHPEAPSDPTDTSWEQEIFRAREFQSVQQVTYAGSERVEFNDTSVKSDNLYVYKITSLGFVSLTTESAYSEPEWVLAGDRTPPGAIQVISAIAQRDIVRIKFVAPDDPDYEGVRVYGPYTQASPVGQEFDQSELIKVEFGEPGQADQVFFRVEEVGDYYISAFDALGNERAPADSYQYTYDQEDFLPPDHVSNVVVSIDSSDPLSLGLFPRLVVSWAKPEDDDRYGYAEVQLSLDDGGFVAVGESAEGRLVYDGWWDTKHTFRVVAVSKFDSSVKADASEAPEDSVTTDSADSEFVSRFTDTDQFDEDTPPGGYFYVLIDTDGDDIKEEVPLTTFGTISS